MRIGSRAHVVVSGVASLMIIGTGVGLAASGGHPSKASSPGASQHGVIHACVAPPRKGRVLHYLKSGGQCAKGQSELHWNTTGQRGPTGKRGARGETGATGLDYKRIITVSPAATATASGTALFQAAIALASAKPAPSAANPYEIFVEPGVYDLGVQHFLVLPPDVELNGAGENVTTIIGTNDDGVIGGQSGSNTVSNLTVQMLWTTSGPGSGETIQGIDPEPGWTVDDVRVETTQTGNSAPGVVGIDVFGSDGSANIIDTTVDVSGNSPSLGVLTRIPLAVTGSTFAATSALSGEPTISLSDEGDPGVKIANTELDAPPSVGGPIACVDDYNADFTPLDSSCS